MDTILKQDLNNEDRLTSLKSGLNKYLIGKNQIRDYPKPIWFKGSRYRKFII